jgi:hypothetical protein
MTVRLALACTAALLLAACGADKKQEGAGKAEGEILPGSTSDAMLPYDSVRSQPPLAPKAETSGSSSDKPNKASAPSPASSQPAASAEEPSTEADSESEE